ncbi:hypothetical protein [Lysobacter sp. Root494]|uniref:hypothetical protein n=1 Tax=Lysobacter sp. Root494 TaxID=1736549 RepID=UPI0006FD6E87|nr:hypothetical protein [Lysobacter sp. Root494]KQY51185.1 hypothetical protein ASD14_10300 [Lysobacter sp. Root494]
MTTTPAPSGPACSLEAHAFRERVAWIAALNQRSLHRLDRQGPTLTLVYEASALGDIEEMVARERDCCAFLAFDMVAGEEVVLTITVPPDAVGSADELLAPFHDPKADAASCCGACDTPAAPVKSTGVAGSSIATAVAAVVACGACCVLPLAFPAIAATAAGGVLAWFGKAHGWMTLLALLVTVVAWLWIWRESVRRKARISPATLGLMSGASLAVLLAIAWPRIEPSLMAALA